MDMQHPKTGCCMSVLGEYLFVCGTWGIGRRVHASPNAWGRK